MCCAPSPATRLPTSSGCAPERSFEVIPLSALGAGQPPPIPSPASGGGLGWGPAERGWFREEERQLSEHGTMNGAEWLARALAGAGTSHVFFVESVLRRTLLQLKDLGVIPVLAHSEKAAAY